MTTTDISLKLTTSILHSLNDERLDVIFDPENIPSRQAEHIQNAYTYEVRNLQSWIIENKDVETDPVAKKIHFITSMALNLSPRFSNGFRTLISNIVHSRNEYESYKEIRSSIFAPYRTYIDTKDSKPLQRALYASTRYLFETGQDRHITSLLRYMENRKQEDGFIVRIAMTLIKDDKLSEARKIIHRISTDHPTPKANAKYFVEAFATIKGSFATGITPAIRAACDCKESIEKIRTVGKEEELFNLLKLKFPV